MSKAIQANRGIVQTVVGQTGLEHDTFGKVVILVLKKNKVRPKVAIRREVKLRRLTARSKYTAKVPSTTIPGRLATPETVYVSESLGRHSRISTLVSTI